MSEVAAWFSEVSKAFHGARALDGLTLSIPKGSVVGLLGRNGAGKSTALRCLVGLEGPDTGTARVLDRDPGRLDVADRQRIGYLSEHGVPFPGARVERLIRLCAPLYPRWDRALEDRMLTRFQIDPRRRLRELSLGQQRAVGLLLAMCPRPELLILDEPAANLDVVVRREFLETVLMLMREEERTVIFSSHILSDVERVADRVAILERGRLLIDRPLDDLKEQARRLRFIFAGAAPEQLPPLPGVVAVRRAGREMLATVINYDAAQVAGVASALDAHVEAQAVGLEDLFIDLVGYAQRSTTVAA
jgi:ABC-2 type transport system ATP-binding protein